MKHKDAVPVIATANVCSTITFFTGVLGFEEHFAFGEPPVYAGVRRDGALIYIAEDAKLAAMLKASDLHPEVFLWVQDIDNVLAEQRHRGAKIVEEIADRAWDARQYVIEDPNGYHIKVAEPIDEPERPIP